MFERFTDRARRTVVLAQEEARLLNHNYIGTEHLLLGVIHEGEGVAATALSTMGISLDDVRADVEAVLGRGEGLVSGHIPFTPRAKKVLELSLREALQLGSQYIGTEHILLGLLREGDGVAAQVLVARGVDPHRLRNELVPMLHGTLPDTAILAEETVLAARSVRPTDIGARLTAILARLDRIEQKLRPGAVPGAG